MQQIYRDGNTYKTSNLIMRSAIELVNLNLESYRDSWRIFSTSRSTVNKLSFPHWTVYFEKRESKYLDGTSCLLFPTMNTNYSFLDHLENSLASLTTHKSVWHSLRQKWAMDHHYKTISSKSWTLSVLWFIESIRISKSTNLKYLRMCCAHPRIFELHNKKV